MTDPALETIDVAKHFGGVHAVDRVTLRVPPGQIRGVIGPNGAGKTTLLNVLSGVDRASSGEYRLFGQNVTKWSLHRIVHEARVVRTFQTMRLFSTMTARENIQVAAGATLRGDRKLRQRSYRRAGERTDEVIDQLDLGNFAHAPVTDLPYGRRRLVEVARALVADPRMLLLDEPAAGLNTADRERLGALLRDLRGQGMTIVLVEHQMDLVSAVCDELTVLDFGSVLCEGPPKAVIEDQRVLSAYLGGGGG